MVLRPNQQYVRTNTLKVSIARRRLVVLRRRVKRLELITHRVSIARRRLVVLRHGDRLGQPNGNRERFNRPKAISGLATFKAPQWIVAIGISFNRPKAISGLATVGMSTPTAGVL